MAEERIAVKSTQPMQLRTYLRRYAQVSARLLARLKQTPMGITRSGAPLRAADMVFDGDVLVLRWEESPAFAPNPLLQAPVVYESESLVIYDKPVEMPVHPSAKHRTDTLANAYAAQYPQLGFHAVFRLDRNTSGLCIIAKTPHTAHTLQGHIQKKYYALVPPRISGSGTVDAPIGRAGDSLITRCIRDDGKAAVTHYRTLLQTPLCTLLEVTPETGRTHQIRVHMSWLGYPLVGDTMYGTDETYLPRHGLHCARMTLTHPVTGEDIAVSASMPADMRGLLEAHGLWEDRFDNIT